MIDVVPPGGGYPSSSVAADQQIGQRPDLRSVKNGEARRQLAVGPRVVRLTWRLPARLRRPVRHELALARQKKRRRSASAHFKRHALYADRSREAKRSLQPGTSRLRGTAVSQGTEGHTADVYQSSSPSLRLGAPPYAGGVVEALQSSARRGPALLKTIQPRSGQRQSIRRQRSPAKRKFRADFSPATPERVQVGVTSPTIRSSELTPNYLISERDIPFDWQRQSATPVGAEVRLRDRIIEPKRRFALPLHFSIWPNGVRRDRGRLATVKKKLRTRAPLI